MSPSRSHPSLNCPLHGLDRATTPGPGLVPQHRRGISALTDSPHNPGDLDEEGANTEHVRKWSDPTNVTMTPCELSLEHQFSGLGSSRVVGIRRKTCQLIFAGRMPLASSTSHPPRAVGFPRGGAPPDSRFKPYVIRIPTCPSGTSKLTMCQGRQLRTRQLA